MPRIGHIVELYVPRIGHIVDLYVPRIGHIVNLYVPRTGQWACSDFFPAVLFYGSCSFLAKNRTLISLRIYSVF